MKKNRQLAVILFLVIAIFISYSIPVRKEKKPDTLSSLHIPHTVEDWKGENISDTYMDLKDQKYNFVDGVFAARYLNPAKEEVTFSITEAGHFHNPLVCFKGSGYEMKEFSDTQITVCGKNLNVYLFQSFKDGEGFITVYWLCVDKKNLNWWGQMTNLLWTSLLNKPIVSFMVRLDLAVKEGDVEKGTAQLKGFIEALASRIPESDRDFIFGK